MAAEKHAVTCASNRNRPCNCGVMRRVVEAKTRTDAYNRVFAEIMLIECRIDPEWEKRIYLISGLEAT